MSSKNSEWRVWFDLDGVLADFEGGLNDSEDLRKAKEKLDSVIKSDYPDLVGFKADELKLKVKELAKDPSAKLLKTCFWQYNSLVYKIAGKPGFFANLKLLPGAFEMIAEATKITGKKPNVCTAPMGDENDPENHSVKEKKQWVKKHFSDKIDHVEVTLNKGRVVESKFDILIDDRQKYCHSFLDAGGQAIKHETPSAADLTSWKKTVAKLAEICSSNEAKKIKNFKTFISQNR